MNKEANSVNIRKMFMEMKDELKDFVKTAIVIGGLLSFNVSWPIHEMADMKRFGMIFLESLFMSYLLVFDLRKTKVAEPKPEENQPEAQVAVVAEETSAPQPVPNVSDVVIPGSPNLPNIPSMAIPAEVKEATRTVVKKTKGKPTKLPSSK